MGLGQEPRIFLNTRPQYTYRKIRRARRLSLDAASDPPAVLQFGHFNMPKRRTVDHLPKGDLVRSSRGAEDMVSYLRP